MVLVGEVLTRPSRHRVPCGRNWSILSVEKPPKNTFGGNMMIRQLTIATAFAALGATQAAADPVLIRMANSVPAKISGGNQPG